MRYAGRRESRHFLLFPVSERGGPHSFRIPLRDRLGIFSPFQRRPTPLSHVTLLLTGKGYSHFIGHC